MKSAKKRTSFDEKINSIKYDITKRKLVWFLIPVAIVLVGVIILACIGFNLGIDFTGGTVINVVPKDTDLTVDANYNSVKNDITDVLKEYGLNASQFQLSKNDLGDSVSVRFQDKKDLTEEEMNSLIDDSVIPALFEKFDMDQEDDTYANYIQASDRIGATASSELLLNALIAIMASVVLILIYIAIRFEVASGLSAIVALLCDVLVTCSIMLMCRVQINSTFVAALITIIGYSINNTIIIFDRVREVRKNDIERKLSNADIANKAVSQSLVRTINTTITTLVAILLLAIIGVNSVREFAFPIIIGLIEGTFSSVFIAPNLWVLMYRDRKSKTKDSGTNTIIEPKPNFEDTKKESIEDSEALENN